MSQSMLDTMRHLDLAECCMNQFYVEVDYELTANIENQSPASISLLVERRIFIQKAIETIRSIRQEMMYCNPMHLGLASAGSACATLPLAASEESDTKNMVNDDALECDDAE